MKKAIFTKKPEMYPPSVVTKVEELLKKHRKSAPRNPFVAEKYIHTNGYITFLFKDGSWWSTELGRDGGGKKIRNVMLDPVAYTYTLQRALHIMRLFSFINRKEEEEFKTWLSQCQKTQHSDREILKAAKIILKYGDKPVLAAYRRLSKLGIKPKVG